jgi:Tol biopolymer transport system component
MLTTFVVACLAMQSTAGAVLSGKNGAILFTSGRDGGDSVSKLYLNTVKPDVIGETVVGPITPMGGIQYKHSTWSPDRTKIAYSAGLPTGNPLTENFDIYIQDLTNGSVQPLTNITDDLHADRPAWSPDGTRIAYEQETVNGSGFRDIHIAKSNGGSDTNLTQAVTSYYGDAAWSPDSKTLYFQKGDPSGTNTMDIVKRAADGTGSETLAIPNSGASEFQPSISPDGSKICYTKGDGFNNNTDVWIDNTTGASAPTDFSDNPGSGDINCAWSPDGLKIAYVRGVFSAGELVTELSNDSSIPITVTNVLGVFDGNPDWAPDGRPKCDVPNVVTEPNKPVSVPLQCTDTGPQYEQTPTRETVVDGPTIGTLSDIVEGDPSRVVYTPKPGFQGKVTFTYTGFDLRGFTSPATTVTINVTNPPPVLSKLKVNKTIRKSAATPKLSTKKKGTTISFVLSEDAQVTLSFKRTGKLSSSKTVAKGSVTLSAKAGTNRVIFRGKLSVTKNLLLGKYKLTAVATDPLGAKSASKTARFKLK